MHVVYTERCGRAARRAKANASVLAANTGGYKGGGRGGGYTERCGKAARIKYTHTHTHTHTHIYIYIHIYIYVYIYIVYTERCGRAARRAKANASVLQALRNTAWSSGDRCGERRQINSSAVGTCGGKDTHRRIQNKTTGGARLHPAEPEVN